MAKKIGIELDFNTKQAEKSAESFANEIDKTTSTLAGLEEQQDELLAKLKQTQIGTEEFKQLSKELNNTKSQIKDLELGFEGLDMEQRFTAATDALGGVAGGFAAVEGSIALAGVESAEFEETMLRVQGAMALAMGIKDISTAVAALNKLNVAAKLAAAGQRVLNVVLNANPIGLIVTAIGLLVAGFVAFSDKIKSVVMPILKPLINAFEFVKNAVDDVISSLGLIPSRAERAAAAQAEAAYKARVETLKEEKEKVEGIIKAEEEKRQARSDAFDFEIAKLQAAGKETFEVEQEKLSYVLESLKKQKEALIEKHRLEAELVEENSKRYEFNYKLQAAVGNDIVEKSNKRRKEQLDELNSQITKTEQDITIGQIREEKKRNDAAKKAYEDRRKAEEEERKKREDDEKKHAERMLQIDKELAERRAQLNKDARALTREEINAQREQEVQEDENFWQQTYLKTQERLNKDNELRLQKAEEDRQNRIDVAQSINNSLNALDDILTGNTVANLKERQRAGEELTALEIKQIENAEKRKKAFALAQIAIDTAKAISSLTAASQGNPLNAPTGGLAGVAQFASGIAQILANMAQAAALLKKPAPNVNGTSVSTGGGIAGAGVPINAVENGSTLIGQQGNNREVSKVVVVESDITSTQNSISKITEQATVVE